MAGQNAPYCTVQILGRCLEIDFEGEEIRSYGEFMAEGGKRFKKGESLLYVVRPIFLGSIFAGDQERGFLYHCVNSEYLIEVYDSSGMLFRKIDRPYEPVPFTEKDEEDYWAKIGYIPDVFKKEVEAMEMPKVKSIVTKMFVDDESNLWIRTNETKIDENNTLTAFDIFDPDGHYYTKIWTKYTSFLVKKGKMYRMDIDEITGAHTLKRYKILWEK